MGLVSILAVAGRAQDMKSRTWNFDADKAGGIAKGFTNDVGQWRVVADDTAPSKANVLAQQAKSEKPVYNVALITDTNLKNVDLSVKLRAVAGEIDQGGGVVWRAKDARNYYICRYNPLEENFRVYKVEDGKRMELGSANVPATPGWHTLRVVMVDDKFEGYFDGKKDLEMSDATFAGPGHIGLWTKADAQTHFDDLTVTGD
jgi:hypothetical protein